MNKPQQPPDAETEVCVFFSRAMFLDFFMGIKHLSTKNFDSKPAGVNWKGLPLISVAFGLSHFH